MAGSKRAAAADAARPAMHPRANDRTTMILRMESSFLPPTRQTERIAPDRPDSDRGEHGVRGSPPLFLQVDHRDYDLLRPSRMESFFGRIGSLNHAIACTRTLGRDRQCDSRRRLTRRAA